MILVRGTGQSHTYSFSGGRFVDSDPPEEGRGSYTYSRQGNTASLVLLYDSSVGPVDLTGDRHDITLTFEEETRGAYDSVYQTNQGASLAQSGRFEFVQ
jgi:hypothetical protein